MGDQHDGEDNMRQFIFFLPAWVAKALGRFSHHAHMTTKPCTPWSIDACILDPPSVQIWVAGSSRSAYLALIEAFYLACCLP